ncbi:hypothetical protein EDB19DRAFT_1018812 [Suillus lakei]|nr:hypothetical protein EDB19DRAFT_1018812 [Suillus lakei]
MRFGRLVIAFATTVLVAVGSIGLGKLALTARRPRSSNSRYFKGIALSHALQVNFGEPVWMRVDQTAHYRADTDEGGKEFAKLIPRGGHTVNITDPETSESHIYTVTLLHQLKCLGIIRDDYAAMRPPSLMTRHCMNYLRQSILCHPNMRIEPAVNNIGSAVRGYETVCRDWTKVYEEVERLHVMAPGV